MTTAIRPTGLTWIEVAARDICVGDLIANHATCSAVTVGPAPKNDEWPHRPIKRGETRYSCGPDFSSTGKSTRRVVVGRRAVEVAA